MSLTSNQITQRSRPKGTRYITLRLISDPWYCFSCKPEEQILTDADDEDLLPPSKKISSHVLQSVYKETHIPLQAQRDSDLGTLGSSSLVERLAMDISKVDTMMNLSPEEIDQFVQLLKDNVSYRKTVIQRRSIRKILEDFIGSQTWGDLSKCSRCEIPLLVLASFSPLTTFVENKCSQCASL
jgi:hypothetical protein